MRSRRRFCAGGFGLRPGLGFGRRKATVDLSSGVPIGCRSPRKRGPYSMPNHTRDVMETVRTAVELRDSTGKVALLGYCLGGLMVFLTAARCEVDAAVAYHGGDTEKYLDLVGGLQAPLLMHLGEE